MKGVGENGGVNLRFNGQISKEDEILEVKEMKRRLVNSFEISKYKRV